jgi:hypothetical protein
VVVLFALAAPRGDAAESAVWFTAIGAGFAVLGVLGAAFAVYRSDVLEKPVPNVSVEVPKANGADGYDPVAHDTTATVVGSVVNVGQPKRSFDARIHVTNAGRAVLPWAKLSTA